MNKQELASKIWALATELRGKVSAATYKDYMLGFLFYKYLSDKEENYLIEKLDYKKEEFSQEILEENRTLMKNCMSNIGYFITYKNLFSTWVILDEFSIENVTTALSAFERNIGDGYKKVFSSIFSTLSTRITDLGNSDPERTAHSKEIIKLIQTIPTDNKEEYDVLGFIYEYLLKNFAANAGKAGEFYTPHEVSIIMAEIIANHLKNKEEISIYDPTSGSGSLLINIGKAISKYLGNKNKVKYYAQELIQETYVLTKMNLVMRDILPSNIVARQGDTLDKDWPYFEANDPENTYEFLSVDACCSNPPYSQAWEPKEGPRFNDYGLAPKSKSDYAFLLHNLYHLNKDGIMTIVLPHGVLFRGGVEASIRENLIKKHNIDTIIGLPANMFFGTGIPTIIMVLKKQSSSNNILFIDASKDFVKDGNKNKLRQRDIRKIIDTVINRKNIEYYSRVVSIDEIIQNDYNLNIPRYVNSSISDPPYDLYATMFGGLPNKEIDGYKFKNIWSAFPSLKKELFTKINDSYSSLNSDDLKTIIYNNSDVQNFINKHKNNYSYLSKYLEEELISNIDSLHINSEEEKIADSIKEHLSSPLIDYYDCYESLDNVWQNITVDLETIKEQGFESARCIDEIKILKKDSKSKKLEEKITGYDGRIIPFSLIQKEYFKEDLDLVVSLSNSIQSLTSEKEDLLESIDPNDKTELTKNEEGEIDTKKLNSKISLIVKQIKNGVEFEEDSYETILMKINNTNESLKEEKKKFKVVNEKLNKETEEMIQSLSDTDIHSLLIKKWINPICESIEGLSTKLIDNLIKDLNQLNRKYESSLLDIDSQIRETEKELSSMIDDLDANEYDKKGLLELQKLLGGK